MVSTTVVTFPNNDDDEAENGYTNFSVTDEDDDDSPEGEEDDDGVLLLQQLQAEAMETLKEEPELSQLLKQTVLAPCVTTFEHAVARTVCHRLLPQQTMACFCPNAMLDIFVQALACPDQNELGHTMSQAVRRDALCVLERDPACNTLLEVVLFFKGFAALVCHRAARYKWYQQQLNVSAKKIPRTSMTALFLQSQASAVFGVDIHPAATLGAGILLDHGTGIVIGETAVVGDGCTLLHGVTLGGTGKDSGDRHPKIGKYTLIGAGTSILGNIQIGQGCKIGAGSVVLRGIPNGATAVGAPAKIIGHAKEQRPSMMMDDTLQSVSLLRKSPSILTMAATEASTRLSLTSSSNNTIKGELDHVQEVEESESVHEPSAHEPEPEQQEETDEDQDDDVPTPLRRETTATRVNRVVVLNGDQQQHMNNHETDSSSADEFSMCPFRDYARIKAPPGAWSICQFKQWLHPHGVPMEEIQNLFFALDGTRNVGYVYWNDLKAVLDTVLPQNLSCLRQQQQQPPKEGDTTTTTKWDDKDSSSGVLLQTLRNEIPTGPALHYSQRMSSRTAAAAAAATSTHSVRVTS